VRSQSKDCLAKIVMHLGASRLANAAYGTAW
jgi:hypothetical protein